MPKQKKRKEIEQAPEMLLWEIPFEFISPLSLDECSSRLQEINTNSSLFSQKRKVFLSSIEPQKVLFHLSESGGRLGEGWAVGYLEEESGNGTRIIGKAGISPEILIMIATLGVVGLILVPAVLRSLGAFVFVGIIAVFLVWVIHLSVVSIRTNLIDKLSAIFEQPSA